MNIAIEFLICCIEEYKSAHGLSGHEVIALFCQHGIEGYILRHYDALHTAGVEYTIAEIEEMMKIL